MTMPRLLLFVGTEGIYHDHEGNGKRMVEVLNRSGQIEATLSRDYGILAVGLDAYDAVLFYTDVGDLTDAQEAGLLNFIDTGGGFFGLHTASASFRECDGYHAMLNARFDGHSPYMDFTVDITDPDDSITRGLERFTVTDELHYPEHDASRSHRLMQAYDHTTGETHVTAFRHTYGQGRVLYFALGHDTAVMENPNFQEILRRAALWVAGRDDLMGRK